MRDPRRLTRVTRILRSALGSLLDQSQPFGRLAAAQCLQAAGTALVTISLAGSLFFSISPHAAEGKILLYLLLTIAPFAIVGPALSPLLDRGRQARRTSVAVANGGSALACVAMARSLHGLLLFPEAFVILVLGKLYLVAKASLVPQVTGEEENLATANAKLAVLATLAGFAVMPIGLGLLKVGAPWVLRFGAVVFLAGMVAAIRLPRPAPAAVPGSAQAGEAEPARRERYPRVREITEARRRLGLPLYAGEVSAAVNAMSVARATVGFVEFFLAFALRRLHEATWWFGLLILASAVGSLVGSLAVPWLRRFLSERRIILASLALLVVGSLLAGLLSAGVWSQLLLTLVVGIGPTSAKPALDSIVQRHVPPALLGRAFGRLETRLQLLWVLAALAGVLIPFPLRVGDGAIAAVSLLGALSYGMTSSRRDRLRPPRGAVEPFSA